MFLCKFLHSFHAMIYFAGFHLNSHFFSCQFVSASLDSKFSSNISVHLLVVPFLSLCIIEWFSLITSVFCYYYYLPSQYQCVSVSMHLSVGPHFFYKQYCKLEETMECFCFVPLLSFVSLLFSLLLFSSSFDFLHT